MKYLNINMLYLRNETSFGVEICFSKYVFTTCVLRLELRYKLNIYYVLLITFCEPSIHPHLLGI